MITTPDEWAAMTDEQRYSLLTGTQIDRDNLREYIHGQNTKAEIERRHAVANRPRLPNIPQPQPVTW